LGRFANNFYLTFVETPLRVLTYVCLLAKSDISFSHNVVPKRTGHSSKLISNWFTLVQNKKAKYGIDATDIFNFDETGRYLIRHGRYERRSTWKAESGSARKSRMGHSDPGH
jgi:hypothetical protein